MKWLRLVVLIAMIVTCVAQISLVIVNAKLRRTQDAAFIKIQKATQALVSADKKYMEDLANNTNYAHFSVIHRPANGCPAGWRPVTDLFVEKSGSKMPGCWDEEKLKHNDFTVDYLLGGESVELSMWVTVPKKGTQWQHQRRTSKNGLRKA